MSIYGFKAVMSPFLVGLTYILFRVHLQLRVPVQIRLVYGMCLPLGNGTGLGMPDFIRIEPFLTTWLSLRNK